MKPNGPLEGNRRQCPICGAEFWAMRDWQYKRRKNNKLIYICSWKCLSKYDEKKDQGVEIMSRCDIERNAEITMMRKGGATFKEIAEWYGLAPARAQQIYGKYKDYGDSKEEIVRNWEQKQDEKKRKNEELEAWIRKRAGGREYAIRNGVAEVFLTEISGSGGDVVYRYGSKEIRDALMFTKAEATRIARERKAVMCWVP